MNYNADLTKLMKLFDILINSNKSGETAPQSLWKNDARVLSVKFFRHIVTAQNISEGIGYEFVAGQPHYHIDHSSVNIIVRSAIESYLAFNYIFLNEDESLSIYRHKLWEFAGLTDRSKILAISPDSKAIQYKEALRIKKLHDEIERDAYYINSSREERKSIMKGNWKPKGGWHAINNKTNIHHRYFSDLYNHFSGHAHASYISILQVRDARSIDDQAMLANYARLMLCMVISHFVYSYVSFFPSTKVVMDSNPDLTEVAYIWHIQKKDTAAMYGPIQ